MKLLGLLLALGVVMVPDPAAAEKVPGTYAKRVETAIFAGGCFWCMQPPYDALEGVIATTVGYTGGVRGNPTYEEVKAGNTGHAEAIKVVFDPVRVSYAKLLELFWINIDPLARNRQFCDFGSQYRSAIFYSDDAQRKLAVETRGSLEKEHGWKVATEIVRAGKFYEAEEYHQKYYLKNPLRYKYYRSGCGRDRRLKELWGDKKR